MRIHRSIALLALPIIAGCGDSVAPLASGDEESDDGYAACNDISPEELANASEKATFMYERNFAGYDPDFPDWDNDPSTKDLPLSGGAFMYKGDIYDGVFWSVRDIETGEERIQVDLWPRNGGLGVTEVGREEKYRFIDIDHNGTWDKVVVLDAAGSETEFDPLEEHTDPDMLRLGYAGVEYFIVDSTRGPDRTNPFGEPDQDWVFVQ